MDEKLELYREAKKRVEEMNKLQGQLKGASREKTDELIKQIFALGDILEIDMEVEVGFNGTRYYIADEEYELEYAYRIF